jgi:hypothetical protein
VHYALLAGGADGLECVRILASRGALGERTSSLSLSSPEVLSRELGNAEALKLLAPDASPEVKTSPSTLKTMLLYSEGCLAHAASSDYGPESASRLQVLIIEGAVGNPKS